MPNMVAKNQPLSWNIARALIDNSIEDKIIYTSCKIDEWYHTFGDAYIAFSGGKDSQVLADIAAMTLNRYVNKKCQLHLVYFDTGLEYPEIKTFVKTYTKYLQQKYPSLMIDLEILRPTMRFDEVIRKFGYPVVTKRIADYASTAQKNPNSYRAQCLRGEIKTTFMNGKWGHLADAPFKISAYCCDVMKKQPANAYSKRTGRYPITAVMAQESRQRYTEWVRTGCNAYDGNNKMCKPMSFWTTQDVLHYIHANQLPMCSVYGSVVLENGIYRTTGCLRTGCIFCAFGAHKEKTPNRFQHLQKNTSSPVCVLHEAT